jgi:hypothetical protein
MQRASSSRSTDMLSETRAHYRRRLSAPSAFIRDRLESHAVA